MTIASRSLIFALPLVLAAITLASAQEGFTGVASVIDGDTIDIHGHRIRLHGVDAPESRQECVRPDGTSWRCGQQASLALSDWIGRATLRCEPHDRDRYRRIVAICFKETEDLNRWMVANGWAVAYRKYSRDYVADEERAHSAGLQIWSGPFEMPWDWRQQRRHR